MDDVCVQLVVSVDCAGVVCKGVVSVANKISQASNLSMCVRIYVYVCIVNRVIPASGADVELCLGSGTGACVGLLVAMDGAGVIAIGTRDDGGAFDGSIAGIGDGVFTGGLVYKLQGQD